MRVRWTGIAEILVDPVDHSPLHLDAGGAELVSDAGARYAVVDDQPVLLTAAPRSDGGWTFPPVAPGQQDGIRVALHGPVRRTLARVKQTIRSRRSLTSTVDVIKAKADCASTPLKILVVGGGTVGQGAAPLESIPNTKLISFDVYSSSNTTFVADGHRIPLADESIDVAWVQAVLEHVVQPSIVVDEVSRVLVEGGIVYAETPFLQPVHEGPFDFTRFTQSGHRLLFHDFDEIAVGAIGGPGAVAALAIRGIVGGVTRSTLAARLAYVVASVFAFADRFVSPAWRADFATGTTFLGAKRSRANRLFDALDSYRGAQTSER